MLIILLILIIFAGCSATENTTDRNIRIVKGIVEDYHSSHTYSSSDMFVCGDMATDVWNMVETQGINAVISVGNLDRDISTIKDANHVWVLAEISPNIWLALETTGGFAACSDPKICPVDNPRYYKGFRFGTPKELKDALDKLKHPCPDGYVLGNDELCHEACGGGSYCTGDSVCVNGECRGCSQGYILGKDLKCHEACGSTGTYCTGNSVCIEGECKGCAEGLILGDDFRCHQPCGSTNTYCSGDSVCINGECKGCSSGYYLGTDLKCYKI